MIRILSRMVSLLCIAFIAGGTASVSAQAPEPPSPPIFPKTSTKEYLLMLPLPSSTELRVDFPIRLGQAEDLMFDLALQRMRPVLRELPRLQAQGIVAAYEFRPDQNAIAIQTADPGTVTRLAEEAGVMDILPAENSANCVRSYLQARQAQLSALSSLAQAAASRLTPVQETNPSVNVSVPLSTGYASVFGNTDPSVEVTMRVLRNDEEVSRVETASDSEGSYSFASTWTGCGADEEWDWTLATGDVVEVSAGGNTVQIDVVLLWAWIDPASNSVGGETQPGWVVSSILYPDTTACDLPASLDMGSPTDEVGAFRIDYPRNDFDRSATAYVYAFNPEGNSVFGYFYAFHVFIDLDRGVVYGAQTPSNPYTVTLARGGQPQGAWDGFTETDGTFSTSVNTRLLPGDEISVSGQDVTFSTVVAPLTLNYALGEVDQVSGTTTPGSRVQMNTATRAGTVPGQCSMPAAMCGTATTDENGGFTFTMEENLFRGEEVQYNVYDVEGNRQRSRRPVPLVVADLSDGIITGFWGGAEDSLVVTLLDESGAVKETIPEALVSPIDRSFFAVPAGSLPAPNDRIQVTGGDVTEAMTVADLTARLDAQAGQLIGSAPAGRLTVRLDDLRIGEAESTITCQEVDVDGEFAVGFEGAQVGAQDLTDMYFAGPDGHYTYRWAPAFLATVYLDTNTVGGFTSERGAAVTISLWDGETLLEEQTVTSGFDYWYEIGFSTPFAPGLRVAAVETVDAPAEIVIPNMELDVAAGSNSIRGVSAPDEPVRVILESRYACGSAELCREELVQWTTADGNGEFEVSFEDLAFRTMEPGWEQEVCTPAQVDGPCVLPVVNYLQADEHTVYFAGPLPEAVTEDAFEGDDTPAEARPYDGREAHTFHTQIDVDWISFEVTPDQVGLPFTLATVNLGRSADTFLELYAEDGTTQLAADDDGGLIFASQITWFAEAAGTYLLKVSSFSPTNTANCGASYEVLIEVGEGEGLVKTQAAFLPLVNGE